MPRRGQLMPLWDGQSGLDAGADPHGSPAWKVLSNVEIPRRGALAKRTGTNRSAFIPIAALDAAITSHPSAPIVTGGQSVGYYDVDNDATRLARTDWPLININAERVLSVRSGAAPNFASEAVGEVYDGDAFWAVTHGLTQGALSLTTIDKSTGSIIDTAQLQDGTGVAAGEAALARIVRVGSANQCYYVDSSGNLGRREVASDGTIASPATSTPSVNIASRQYLDVAVTSDGDAYVAYPSSATVFTIARYAGGVGVPAKVAAYTASGGIVAAAIWPVDTDKVTALWSVTNGANSEVIAQVWDDTLTQVSSDVTVDSLATASFGEFDTVTGIALDGPFSGGNSLQSTVYYALAAQVLHAAHYDVAGTGTVASVQALCIYARIASKPAQLHKQLGGDHSLCLHTVGRDSGAVTVDTAHDIMITSDALPIASINRGVAGGAADMVRPIAQGATATSPVTGPPLVYSAIAVADVYEGKSREVSNSIEAMPISEYPVAAIDNADGAALIGGALPTQLVRGELYEQGWLTDPGAPHSITGTTGGLMAIGSAYQMVVVFEYHDRQGRRSQSAPSPAYTHTPSSSSDQAVQLSVARMPVTLRTWEDTYAVVYRTTGNGTVLYRDASFPLDSATQTTVFNIGKISDADLSANEVLYTDQGILDAAPPRPYTVSTIHHRRHVVVPTRLASSRVDYSREIVPAETPYHNELLQLGIDSAGGDITAMASHRDALIVFKASRTIVYEGEGAADDGSGATFRRPYTVSDSMGALSWMSVLKTPIGVFFDSADGIALLDNSFKVQPIGDAVRYYRETYGQVFGAAAIRDRSQAVFFLASSSAPLLVFDWLAGQWSSFQPPNTTSTICEHDGRIVRLDGDGYVWTEDTASHDDNGAFVPMALRTGWVSHADWQRVKEVLIKGYYRGAATLRVKVGYDRDAYWLDSQTFDPTVDLTAFDFGEHYGAGSGTYEDQAFSLRFDNLTQQKCSSYRVEISDEQLSGQTAGFTITGVFALVSAKPGTKDIGDERRI